MAHHRTLAALSALSLMMALPAAANPRSDALEPAESQVNFETDFGPDLITGTMPVAAATVVIDFDNLAASRVTVDLDAGRASASFPFATQAMTGARVLDTANYPLMHFETTEVTALGPTEATLDGTLTLRGIAQAIRLHAAIYRQQGTAPGDLSALVILLTGALNRSAYGANGWSDLVGDQVRLTIHASIVATD